MKQKRKTDAQRMKEIKDVIAADKKLQEHGAGMTAAKFKSVIMRITK